MRKEQRLSHLLLAMGQEDEAVVWGQRVERYGNLSGDAIQFSSGDSSHPRVTAVGEGWLVAWAVNGPGTWEPMGHISVREVAGDGTLPGTTLTMSAAFDEVTAVAVVGDEDYLAAWAGSPYTGGGGASMAANLNVYGSLARRTTQLQDTVIAYTYDPLYRLTGAAYSDGLTAGYSYVYDAVGNMTAFTETVDSITTVVTRTFNAANRLQTALDLEAGTTSYYYRCICRSRGNVKAELRAVAERSEGQGTTPAESSSSREWVD